MVEKAKQIAELLKGLANENRLLILCALIEQPMNVTELSLKVPNIGQSALSQHLSVLKMMGFVDNEKKGLNVIYSIKDYRIEEIIFILKKNYCN